MVNNGKYWFIVAINDDTTGGFHSHGGTPVSLDGLFHGNSHEIWMMTGGTPIPGNPYLNV